MLSCNTHFILVVWNGIHNIMEVRLYNRRGKDLKKMKIELSYDSTITLRYMSKRKENTNSKRYMLPTVNSSIIYNKQDMKTT